MDADEEQRTTELTIDELTHSVPDGFRLNRLSAGELEIIYRRKGMGCMVLFLGVWLTGWSAGGAFAIYTLLFGNAGWGERAFMGLWLCAWLLGETLVSYFLAWNLFGRTRIVLDVAHIRIEKILFNWIRTQEFERESIRSVRQVKDGGEGDDSFPSWGLKISTGGKRKDVLSRQTYDKSLWLGRLLSVWSGKEFKSVVKDD